MEGGILMSLVKKAAVARAVTPGPGRAGVSGVAKAAVITSPGVSPVAKAAVIASPGRRRR